MKVKFYVDIYPGMKPTDLTAWTHPVGKQEGIRRFCFEVEMPDTHFPDETQTATASEVQ